MNCGRLKLLLFAFYTVFSCAVAGSSDFCLSSNDPEAHAYIGDGVTEDLFDTLSAAGKRAISNKNNYSSYYFYNLDDNFSNNAYGSCGYVATGMLLSFYDAYWDDTVIEAKYDVHSTFEGGLQDGADFHLVPMDSPSPGIEFEPSELVGGLSVKEYVELAKKKADEYFQFKLFEIGLDGLDFGMTGQKIESLMRSYLYEYRNYSRDDILIEYAQKPAKEKIIDKLESGVPVILAVAEEGGGSHVVIGYDCNRKKGEIYVHPGWRKEGMATPTHVALSDIGYTDILSSVNLNFKSAKKLGPKYYSSSGDGYAASNYMLPREIEIKSGNYVDTSPTFEWKSLYEEKWENFERHFDLALLDSNKMEVYRVGGINSLKFTIGYDDWQTIMFGCSGKTYYVYLTLSSNEYPYWDDLWCRQKFTKPSDHFITPVVYPHEYGFSDSYPIDDGTKQNFTAHDVRGFKFETRRYRTGYIHNEGIVMSSIRAGINEAFIEYRFETAIERIDVELSHWRELKSELLSSANGTASVQYYLGGEWNQQLDLLSSEVSLSRNRNNKTLYKIEFDTPVYRFRFYSSYRMTATNDSNKGRICIGKMAFYESGYSFPLSGSEVDYDESIWASCKNETNCYAYALDIKRNPYPTSWGLSRPYALQPGLSGGLSNMKSANEYLQKDYLLKMIAIDAKNYNFTFESIGAEERCDEGNYKVALFVFPNYDYHWYRQNSDGLWSHKPGSLNVRNVDFSNKLIYNPQGCDRKIPSSSREYSEFYGYYQVNIREISI